MVFKQLKNLCAAVFMLFCVWSILATSQASQTIDHSDLYVISDCVVPTLESPVSTVNSQIVTPVGRSYTDFGFPTTVVSLANPVTGTWLGKSRNCIVTYGDRSNGDGWIYSCYDNGTFNCSIMIKPQ